MGWGGGTTIVSGAPMASIRPSFSHWPYPNKGPLVQHCCWGSCGLFAHSMNRILTIYSEDSDCLVPLVFLPPFESNITAIT
jgi:hypothetical protein